MGKVYHGMEKTDRVDMVSYTKHYYAGSERVSAKTQTLRVIGSFPQALLASEMPNLNIAAVRAASTASVTDAGAIVTGVYNKFGMTPPPLAPTVENNRTESYHDPAKLNISYFHPDHLGSSSYITNASGIVTQHLEYMAFGEVFVEEHSNSLNSPFKFNGKELDGETGNYYYGARYYDPKLSTFISVDPLAEQTMSAYGYCYNNPVNLVDPTGMVGEDPIDPPKPGQGTNSGSMEGENPDGSPNGKVATIMLDNVTITHQRQSKKSTSSMDGYFKPAYDTSIPNKFSPSTDWRYSVAITGVVAIPVLIEVFGAAAISEFVIEEAAENAFEQATGIPVVVNPIDIVEYGVKKGAKEGVQYTVSSLKMGQEMHKSYKIGANGIKEFRLPSGKRIDYLDIENYTIYELKPFNPRSIKLGERQLDMYKNELESIPRFQGIQWKTILDTY